jgi:hypothetical protein
MRTAYARPLALHDADLWGLTRPGASLCHEGPAGSATSLRRGWLPPVLMRAVRRRLASGRLAPPAQTHTCAPATFKEYGDQQHGELQGINARVRQQPVERRALRGALLAIGRLHVTGEFPHHRAKFV